MLFNFGKYSRVVCIVSTVIIPDGERLLRPLGMARFFGKPAALFHLTRRLSSKNTLTCRRYRMNVSDDTRKRGKSNGTGIGAGSLSVIAKLVHALDAVSSSDSGSCPLRAKSLLNVSGKDRKH